MLNFDEQRFVRIQAGAVALAAEIGQIVTQALDGGVDRLVFLGTGGAGILMLPAAHLLQTRSTFACHVLMPAEYLAEGSAQIGPSTLVVMPSRSGTTSETLEAVAAAQSEGATVLALTAHADSPLAASADHTLVNFAEDDTSSESFYLQSLLVVLSVLKHKGDLTTTAYDEVVADLAKLPQLLLDAKRAFEPRAAELAAELKDEPWHIISGAGSTWPEAFYYGMCILEEMQWIRTRPVHASDFFHGTLELLEEDVSVILLKGEDIASRQLVERVETFVPRYSKKLRVLDAGDVELPGISAATRELVSPAVLATLLERLSAHLEVLRDHPLTTRRYYRQFAY